MQEVYQGVLFSLTKESSLANIGVGTLGGSLLGAGFGALVNPRDRGRLKNALLYGGVGGFMGGTLGGLTKTPLIGSMGKTTRFIEKA